MESTDILRFGQKLNLNQMLSLVVDIGAIPVDSLLD